MLRCELSTLAAAGLWLVTRNEVSGGSQPRSVSCHITSFPSSSCMHDRPHFTAQHNLTKDNEKNKPDMGCGVFMMIVLNQFLPLALSQLTIGCPLKKVNKPARNLPVPAKGRRDLTGQAPRVKTVDCNGES